MSLISLIPQNVTVGENAQIIFKFVNTSEMENFIFNFTENDEIVKNLNNSPFFTIKALHLENTNQNATILIEFIAWKAGELNFGSLPFCKNCENLKDASNFVTIPPVFIRSVAEETNSTQLAPPTPPSLIPGTSYLIYASVAIFLFFIAIFTILALRFKALRTFFEKLTLNLRKSKNYRKMIKEIKRFTKAKYQNQIEGTTKLVTAFRLYLQKRFNLPFLSAATFEIPVILKKNWGNFYNQAVENFLPVLTRCDQVRFCKSENILLKENDNKDLGLKLVVALNILENEA